MGRCEQLVPDIGIDRTRGHFSIQFEQMSGKFFDGSYILMNQVANPLTIFICFMPLVITDDFYTLRQLAGTET